MNFKTTDMKSTHKETLTTFLRRVNKNRKRFGDMFIHHFRDQKGRLELQFSNTARRFVFNWDSLHKTWLLESGR